LTCHPLRAHKEDIALLADTFLQMHAARLGRTARLKREALAAIEKYDCQATCAS